MIEAVEVVRDELGMFFHPEWCEFLGDREALSALELSEWEAENGCSIVFINFDETVDEGSEAWNEYHVGGNGFTKWDLMPPRDSAVLLAVADTEEGPMQLWAVPANNSKVALAQVETVCAQEAGSNPVELRPIEPLPLANILNYPRLVAGHAVDGGVRGDMGQAVIAHGPYSPGRAQNHYIIGVGAECELLAGGAQVLGCISFQDGNPQEVGPNGVTIEAVLAVCADRLEHFQDGPHANRYNAEALTGIERALEALKDRTRERDAGGA